MGVKALAAATLALLSLSLVFEPVLAANDPPPAGGTVSGDWTVTDTRSYSNVLITLDHGNLVIRNGGSLTLSDVDLVMRMDQNGQFQIEVQAGGTLVLKNGCTVTCSNTALRYNFRIRSGAFATLGNSTIRHAGYTYDGCPADNNGIYVASGNATIDSCTISDSACGVYIDNAAPRVSNCLFRTIGSYGIYVSRGSPSLLGNDFTNGYIGIYCTVASPWISRCSFSTNYYGVYTSRCKGLRVENCTFRDHYYNGVYTTLYSTTDIRDSTFTHNGNSDWYYGGGIRYNEYSGGVCQRNTFSSTDYGSAVTCYDSASPWVDRCDISQTYRPGIYTDYRSTPRVTNSTIFTVGTYDAAVVVTGSSQAALEWCAVISDVNIGTYVTGYASLSMANCSVRARNSYALYLASSGSIFGRDCDISARYYGVYSSRGDLDLLRCNLTSSEYIALFAGYGSDCFLDRCTVTGYTYGIYVYYYDTRVKLRDTWVEAKYYYGALVVEGRLEIQSSNIYATRSYAIYASSNATVNSYNSTLTTGSQTASYVYLDTGGNCRLNFYNTLFDQFRVTFTEPTSTLNVSWYVNVAVLWTAARAPNASLVVSDAANRTVYDGAVDQRGERFGLVVQEYRRSQLLWENYSKFEFTASKNGIRKSEKRDIRSNNQTVRLVLSDPDPPVISIQAPQGNLQTNRTRILFSGTAEDYASGLASVEWSLDGGNWSAATGLAEWNFTLDLVEGRHTVRVRAFDIAGSSRVEAVTVTVDTLISLELDGPRDGALLNNGTVLVSGTAEPYSNVSAGDNSTQVDSDGRFEFVLRLADGPHNITVTARDETGNSKTVEVHFLVDTVPPEFRLDSPLNGTATASPLASFRGRTDPDARLYIGGNLYYPEANGSFSVMVPLGEGLNVLEVRALDAAGNFRNTTVAVLLDTIPPLLAIESPGNGLLTNRPELEVRGWTDGGSVTAGNVTATLEGGLFSARFRLSEGLNRIEVVSRDAVGNTNSSVISVTLDTVAPYLQITNPAEGLMTNGAALTVSGVTEPGTAVTVNGGTTPNLNGLFSHAVRLVAGPNFILVKAVDAAGNVAQVNRTVTLDQEPPALSITSPAAESRIPDGKVMVRGLTDPGSTVTVNGVSAQMERTGRFTAEISLTEGSNSIVVTSVDPAGNPTTKMVKVTRTGALSVSGAETPLLLIGLAVGVAVGAVIGVLVARRRRKEQVVVMAPEEPEPGKYYVPEEPVPRPPRQPPVVVDLPPPEYARHDEAYHPPPEQHLPAIGAPEESLPTEPGPIPAGPGPGQEAYEEQPVPWEEEERARPRKAPDVDGALDDIMKRLKS